LRFTKHIRYLNPRLHRHPARAQLLLVNHRLNVPGRIAEPPIPRDVEVLALHELYGLHVGEGRVMQAGGAPDGVLLWKELVEVTIWEEEEDAYSTANADEAAVTRAV
jgi:hypothetical protein